MEDTRCPQPFGCARDRWHTRCFTFRSQPSTMVQFRHSETCVTPGWIPCRPIECAGRPIGSLVWKSGPHLRFSPCFLILGPARFRSAIWIGIWLNRSRLSNQEWPRGEMIRKREGVDTVFCVQAGRMKHRCMTIRVYYAAHGYKRAVFPSRCPRR